MASPPTRVRYIGPDKELYGLAGIAYLPTCLGNKQCEEEMKERGQTKERPFSFVPSVHGEPHFNEEFFVTKDDLVWGDYMWETEDYPEEPNV